jgi:hypothetical protein
MMAALLRRFAVIACATPSPRAARAAWPVSRGLLAGAAAAVLLGGCISSGSSSAGDAGGGDGGRRADAGGRGDATAGHEAAGDAGPFRPDGPDDRSPAPPDGGAGGPPDVAVERGTPDAGAPPGPLTLAALQVAGTHNSYHLAPLVALHNSHKYSHRPLDQQLDGGVRALELDVHLRDDGTFDIYHIALIDPRASCPTLEVCLRVIATWSAAHPRHTPIFVWLELKDDTGGNPIDDPQKLEDTILRVLPRERLITPMSLRGTFASPRERVTAAGWPPIDDVRGKVMISVLNRDARARVYTHDFTSLDDRLMFVSAAADQLEMPWAVVTEVNLDDDPAAIRRAHALRLLVKANVCAVDRSDDDCRQRLTRAVSSGVHMLKDDLPFVVGGRAYFLQLPGGSPGCNPVTAPASCASAALE